MSRNISENGLKFTAAWEKFKAKAYRATSAEKYLTIGFGHYGADVKPTDVVTEEQAYAILKKDMADAVKLADNIASHKFNQAQFDAICDLIFNVGPKAVAADTGTGQAVRAGDVETLKKKLPQFRNQAGKPVLGIYRRAMGRLALFNGKPWKEAEEYGRGINSL